MALFSYILLPCQYSNQLLTIKSLDLQAEGDSPEQALLNAINSTALYLPLISSKFIQTIDWRENTHLQLEIAFDSSIYNKIITTEPLVNSSPKIKRQETIVEPDATDVLRYGY